MCGYSELLEDTRDAIAGDRMRLRKFRHVHGFADVTTPACAVCIPNGAQLTLSGISRAICQRNELSKIEPVTFIEGNIPSENDDAVQFKHGLTMFLRDLNMGITATVIALEPATVGTEKSSLLCEILTILPARVGAREALVGATVVVVAAISMI